MTRKIIALLISTIILLALVRLPIFPLVSEVREFSQDGESLYQTWQFVSLGEFYEASRFAMNGWLDTTWRNYLLLAAVNHAGLAFVFFASLKLIQGVFSWKKSPV